MLSDHLSTTCAALSAPAISKHLKVLKNAGLISRSRIAQTRPCKLEAADFIKRYRQFWEQRLDRRADYLKQLPAQEKNRGHRKHK